MTGLCRMDATRNQRTIAATAAVEGVGYWSGRDVPRGVPACAAAVRDRLRSRRFARLPADSRRDRQPRGEPAADGAALGRGGGGHDRARHGGVGGHADRQLRNLGQPGGNARLRRLRLPFVARPARGGHRRAGRPAAVRRIRRVLRLGDEKSWIEARPSPCRPDDHPIRTGLRQRQPDRPAIAGNPRSRRGSSTSTWPRAGRSCWSARRRPCRPRDSGSAPPSATCWSSTPTGRSTTPCDSPTSACGTRSST